MHVLPGYPMHNLIINECIPSGLQLHCTTGTNAGYCSIREEKLIACDCHSGSFSCTGVISKASICRAIWGSTINCIECKIDTM